MTNKKTAKGYLKDFLKISPLSHALWRSVEALSFNQINFKSPVLDIGCGFGEFAGVAFGRLEMGIDISGDDLKKALKGKRYKSVKMADARDLPFKSSSYSTVVSNSVFEHIEDAEKVIFEVFRVLKKGGIFAFTVPTITMQNYLLAPKILNSLGFQGLAEKYWDLHVRAFKHMTLKPKSWWADKLKRAGFEIVRQEGTLSPTLLRLHEIFLLSAFPSQFGKLFFGKRLMMSVGLRSTVLPIFFTQFVVIDKNSDINIFFVAKKL